MLDGRLELQQVLLILRIVLGDGDIRPRKGPDGIERGPEAQGQEMGLAPLQAAEEPDQPA